METATKTCRCGLPLAGGNIPCPHCDTVCLIRKCPRCNELHDKAKDAEYYGFDS